MLDKTEVRALFVLRLLASSPTPLHPTELLTTLIPQEWERLDIGREFPYGIKAPNLYVAFAELAQWGLVDDFTPARRFIAAYDLTIPALHVLVALAQSPTGALDEAILRERFRDHADLLDNALKRLVSCGFADRDAGRVILVRESAAPLVEAERLDLARLLAKQTDWDVSYSINDAGRAAAATLGEEWQTWTPLETLAKVVYG